MGFFSKLNPQLFLIAFAVGIFYCYITFPEPKIIIQHPTPTNADKVVYQDENENCYKYDAIEVDCPVDKKLILAHPLRIK